MAGRSILALLTKAERQTLAQLIPLLHDACAQEAPTKPLMPYIMLTTDLGA